LAAEQGHAEGQFFNARCYLLGAGVEQDKHHAFELLNASAEHGFPVSMTQLAAFYRDGLEGVVEPDEAKAAEWEAAAKERRAGSSAAGANTMDPNVVYDMAKDVREREYVFKYVTMMAEVRLYSC
jgi:TPR repeat protein